MTRIAAIALAAVSALASLAPAAAQPDTKAVLTFGTYITGKIAPGRTFIEDIAVAPDGHIYVVGTSSPEDSGDGDPNGDLMVQKLTPDGRDSMWERYYDSGDGDAGRSVAFDPEGNVYVAGSTYHGNFPTTEGAFMSGPNCASVLLKLTSEGQLVFATGAAKHRDGVCPGSADADLAVDAAGNAYMIGTGSGFGAACSDEDFKVIGDAGEGDLAIVVVKMSEDGTEREWATCIAGDGSFNSGEGIQLSPTGEIYITGLSDATDLGVGDGYQSSNAGNYDAFVARLADDGASIERSTYFGGPMGDYGRQLAFAADGDVVVVGAAGSGGLATPGAAQSHKGGDQDQFLARFSTDLSELDFASYLGGAEDEYPRSVVIGPDDSLYTAGTTESKRFPVTGQFMSRLHGRRYGGADAYVAALSADGSSFRFSTYLGGSGDYESAEALWLLSDGRLLVAGDTTSSDLPLIDPPITEIPGPVAGFLHTIEERSSSCDFVGDPGDNRIYGSPEGDILCGGSGKDRLFGRDGDDILKGGSGRDRCNGGPGRDRERSC